MAKNKNRTLTHSTFSKPLLIVFILIFATIGGYAIYRSFAATPNVYVSLTGNDSTCVRGDSTKPCATFTQAYDIAQAGDTVQAACGNYPNTYLEGNKASGPNIVFTPASNYCVTIGDPTNGSISFSDGGSYSTWQYFNLPGGLYQDGSNFVNGLVIDHNHIAVDQQATGTINNFHLVNGLQFTNNTIGPSCCHSSSSPEGLRIGTPGGASSTNVLIKGNLIQYTLRTCDYWPSTYELDGHTLSAGSCPDTTCTSCHEDGIHIWGLTNSTIEDNRLVGVEVQGIYIENSSGVAGLQNSNINIINNQITLSGGSAAINLEGNGTQPLWSGTNNVAFNTTNELIEIASYNGMSSGTVFNLVGNIGQLMNADVSGNNNGCQGQASGVTVNYAYNAWLPTSGGTNGPCGTGDIGNANVTFVDAINNLDLAGGSTQANNLVPASICNQYATTDIHGNTRPATGFCDAGADEFGGSSGGGTPAPTVNLSASPTSVNSGSSSTLTWSSTNATSCTASGVWSGSVATSGSQSTGNLSSSSTYNLSCTGAGGTANASATVTVSGSGGGGSSITIGETNVLTGTDHNNANILLAQSTTLSQTANIQSLSFYVTNAAGKLRLGIYDATGASGGPGNLKAQTAEFTPVTGWNTSNVTSQISLSPGTYWLAYLPSDNNLTFSKGLSGSAKWLGYTYGPLPATFSTPTNSDSVHWSLYATLSTSSSTSTPGDADGDGHVGSSDLVALLASWHSTTSLNADFNKDGIIDLPDLSILLSHYGT